MSVDPGQVVGRVIGVWRYPVKSLGGETLASVEAGEAGFVGDRAFGIVDVTTGQLLSAKHMPVLLGARAMYRDEGEVTIVLPGGGLVCSDDDDVNDRLSEWLARAVYLDRPTAGQRSRVAIEIDLDDPSVVVEFQTRPGLFFDGSVMHLLTTSSLAAARAVHPADGWVPERFRPNVLVETSGDGFVEDGWVGCELEVSGMRVDVHKRCDRCVMVTRALPLADVGCSADKGILRALARAHGSDLGVKAHVTGAGRVRVGDDVTAAAR